MKLYHYNQLVTDELLTKRAQGILTPEEIREAEQYAKRFKRPGPYCDHISFFMDPIPSSLLAHLFGDFHPVWYRGNEVIEHVVDTRTLDSHILYNVVETPEKLKHLDSAADDDDSDEWLISYFKELNAIQTKNGELGQSLKGLDKQIIRFQGKLGDYYQSAKNRHDWEENKTKYAASVPHVMLYPSTGRIPVASSFYVTVGSDTRKPVPKALPVYSKWTQSQGSQR